MAMLSRNKGIKEINRNKTSSVIAWLFFTALGAAEISIIGVVAGVLAARLASARISAAAGES
jgi:hypothetical protein